METTADDVQELITSFWRRMNDKVERKKALADLGLQDPVDDNTVKQAYRKLVMKHHPDRGGEKEKLQKINAALAKLNK